MEKQTGVDIDFALKMFSEDKTEAIELLRQHMNEYTEDKCLEYEEKYRVSDQEVRSYFAQNDVFNINELKQLEISKRNKIIGYVKSKKGVTIRQLSRITGISKSVIDRI